MTRDVTTLPSPQQQPWSSLHLHSSPPPPPPPPPPSPPAILSGSLLQHSVIPTYTHLLLQQERGSPTLLPTYLPTYQPTVTPPFPPSRTSCQQQWRLAGVSQLPTGVASISRTKCDVENRS
ncbi:unnamed protein product [Hydatigera taeniaeformis]|uniref:CTNNB1 binding N-teminal domain-containing protein n=1 Tax=Hydatigena taeniaeformis TaxID=6205 RepID=A0A0R3X7H7_HYDTA|nr:unnamed protein product [Hydatigera taeniaeformis]